jgi:hypothetical protein
MELIRQRRGHPGPPLFTVTAREGRIRPHPEQLICMVAPRLARLSQSVQNGGTRAGSPRRPDHAP